LWCIVCRCSSLFMHRRSLFVFVVVVVVVVVKVIKAMTRLLPRTHSLTPKRDEDVVVVVVVVVVRRRCC